MGLMVFEAISCKLLLHFASFLCLVSEDRAAVADVAWRGDGSGSDDIAHADLC